MTGKTGRNGNDARASKPIDEKQETERALMDVNAKIRIMVLNLQKLWSLVTSEETSHMVGKRLPLITCLNNRAASFVAVGMAATDLAI